MHLPYLWNVNVSITHSIWRILYTRVALKHDFSCVWDLNLSYAPATTVTRTAYWRLHAYLSTKSLAADNCEGGLLGLQVLQEGLGFLGPSHPCFFSPTWCPLLQQRQLQYPFRSALSAVNKTHAWVLFQAFCQKKKKRQSGLEGVIYLLFRFY